MSLHIGKKLLVKTIALATIFLAILIVKTPTVEAHGLDEMHSEHHGVIMHQTVKEILPSGYGLPAGVTRTMFEKRYQWTGSFWRLMSKETW